MASSLKNECDKYEKIRKLYQHDGLSCVSVYRWKSDNTEKAGKEVIKSLYTNWKEEFKHLKEVANSHPNVVQYFDAVEHDKTVIFFMELCDYSLHEYVSKKECGPSEDPRDTISPLDVCKQAVEAIYYLHETHNLIHRDIKPANFLVVRRNNETKVKVADFGLSRKLPEDQSSVVTGSKSTRAYMAPECHELSSWRKSSDIFSLGIVMFYVLSNGHHPFGEKDYDQVGNIYKNNPPILDSLRKSDSKNLRLSKEQKITASDLVKRMLRHNHKERLTIKDVSAHPIFWTSKKKMDYYKNVKQLIFSKEGEKFVAELNKYDPGLLSDNCSDSGNLTEFALSLDIIPPLVRRPKSAKGKNRHIFPITKCENVKDLLRHLRNLAEHILDDSNSAEAKESVGVTKDGVNWDVFLEKLTGQHPQLLVHIYEVFRGKGFNQYYTRDPSSGDCGPPSVSSLPASTSHADQTVATSHPTTSSSTSSDESRAWKFISSFLKIDENLLFLYDVTLRYNKEDRVKREHDFRSSSLKICSSCLSDSSLEISLPSPAENEVEQLSAIQKIIEGCKEGLYLRVDPDTKSLLVVRKCQVQIFVTSHIHSLPKKLEREKIEEVFSFEKLNQRNSSLLSPDVEFVFGIKPISPPPTRGYPVSLIVSSKAILSRADQSDSILFSDEIVPSK